MSYSLLAKSRANDFDSYFNMPEIEKKKTKNKSKKNHLVKYVYYYGLPNNENCDEYFSDEKKVLAWIKKNIYLNVKQDLPFSKIALDYFSLNWLITFAETSETCWFVGRVLVSNNKIIVPCKNFDVELIYDLKVQEDNCFEYINIKFIGPSPQLQSILYDNDITYILNIKWDNTHAEKTYANNPILLQCKNYEIHVFSKNRELRAIIKN